MTRKLRLVYENAVYHVVNHGNYRSDLSGTSGAAQAFEEVMFEAVKRYGWELHAYVVMRNHFHLAITTPKANLVAGMHWLQSSYATKLNRFGEALGHVFQRRYKAQIVESGEALARVANYIHPNPVRAKIVEPSQFALFRWSSLRRFLKKGHRPAGLEAASWLVATGRAKTPDDWEDYAEWLVAMGADGQAQKEEGLTELSRGWAFGTTGWKKAIAQEYAHLALHPGIEREQARLLLETHWRHRLDEALKHYKKGAADIASDRKSAAWKIEIARNLRRDCQTANVWIARELNMGHPRAVSSYLRSRPHSKI